MLRNISSLYTQIFAKVNFTFCTPLLYSKFAIHAILLTTITYPVMNKKQYHIFVITNKATQL